MVQQTPPSDAENQTQKDQYQDSQHQDDQHQHLDAKLSDHDRAFYTQWATLLTWMNTYAQNFSYALFEKEADFPDYIYRMARPYSLPTTIMSASLSDVKGNPVLLLSASPRQAVFKEVTLHPFNSHTYRTLTYLPAKDALAEGKRVFTQAMLFDLADELFASEGHKPEV